MIDAVLSVHGDPMTCGVKKWNNRLAQELGVVSDRLVLVPNPRWQHPLLSLKLSELNAESAQCLRMYPQPFSVLWHGGPEEITINLRAEHVFHAEDVGCPSTITGDSTRPGLTILSFGMSHKCQPQHFERMKALLDGRAYTVCVSAAVHEGHPWDETTAEHERVMRGLFGSHLRFLGFLADDALAREIRDAHLVALFYDPAVRANNTTLWAALEMGTPVITNLDAQSPPELIHGKNVFDLAQMTDWPDASELRVARFGGREVAKVYSWERVVSRLQAVHV